MHGQDYRPVADALDVALQQHRRARVSPSVPRSLRGRVPVTSHRGEQQRVRQQLDEARYGPPLLIPVDQIDPNPRNPRGVFDEQALNELAESIKQWKQLQAIVVRRVGERFELFCGERRWRAHQRAGLEQVWAVERKASDTDAYALALVENIQRSTVACGQRAVAIRCGEFRSFDLGPIWSGISRCRVFATERARDQRGDRGEHDGVAEDADVADLHVGGDHSQKARQAEDVPPTRTTARRVMSGAR